MRKAKTRAKIDDQAARWVARMDRGPLPAEDAERLAAWVAQSPRHAGALARAQAIDAHFDRAAALGADYTPDRYRPGAGEDARATPGRRPRLALAAAASVLLAVAVGGLLPTGPESYVTVLGEVRRLPLADGSTLTLNTRTRVAVRFSSSLRRLELTEGEILLDVAEDPRRPFVVDTDGTRVQVTGTRFTVRKDPGQPVEVVVLEGAVEVALQNRAVDTSPAPVSLPGHGVQVSSLATDETERRLKWRDGMLAFNGTTLAEAAVEFARYSNTRLLIDDPTVAQRRVVGLYAATDVAGFAETAAASLGLVARLEPDGIRLLPVAGD